jgi:hypothetical protein
MVSKHKNKNVFFLLRETGAGFYKMKSSDFDLEKHETLQYKTTTSATLQHNNA